MRLRHLTLTAALAALALVIAGCGGGGGDDSTSAPTTAVTTTAPSKEELIARGDSICAEVNAAIGTVGQSSEEGTSQVGQVADLYIGMVESLKDIGAPEDSAGYSEFIAAAEELSQAESEAKLADEREDSAALGAAETKAISALASFTEASEAYGFEECGQEPSAPAPTSGSTESSEAPVEEAAPEEAVEPEAEAAPEEAAPETGGGAGAGGGGEAPSEGSGGGSSGGVGPG